MKKVKFTKLIKGISVLGLVVVLSGCSNSVTQADNLQSNSNEGEQPISSTPNTQNNNNEVNTNDNTNSLDSTNNTDDLNKAEDSDQLSEVVEDSSYDYDPTIDLPLRQVDDYGTTSPFGEIARSIDTSDSIVVDWSREGNVNTGRKQFDEEKVIFKETQITDGKNVGDEIGLQMNIQYHGDASEKTPVVLFIPGGGFSTAQLFGLPVVRNDLANEGYAVATAQYRVIGEGLYEDAVADVNDAIRYVKAHADDYNLDADQVFLLGNSAGGYMVALTATSQDNQVDAFIGDNNLDYTTDVKGVIDLYGLSDLTKIADDYTEASRRSHEVDTSPESHYVNGVYSGLSIMEDLEAAAKANPLTYVDGNEPPFLFMHGDQDLAVSPSQTLILHQKLLDKGVDSTRYLLENATHGRGGFDSQPAMDAIIDFIESNM